MAKAAAFVLETTSTTGTGPVTLDGAVSPGHVAISDVFSDGDIIDYIIRNGRNWETGIGTVNTSTPSLARTRPYSTYSGGTYDESSPTALTLAGLSYVSCSRNERAFDYSFPGLISSSNLNRIPGFFGVENRSAELTLTADREYYQTLYIGGNIANCTFNVITAVASTNLKVKLYDILSTGFAGQEVIDFGSVATTTTGTKTMSITSTYIKPGWYAVGYISDGAPGIGGTNAVAVCTGPFGTLTQQPVAYGFIAGSYATGMPDPASTFTGVSNDTKPTFCLETTL